ncbi:YqcI/YcgG family protein [Salinarimonas soli]|nr:YqcI/YcgG family protein [Salinarimonas soli]
MIEQRHLTDILNAAGQPAWKRVALRQIEERLTPPSDFPCVFSQSAYSRQKIRFSFVPDLSDASINAARQDLEAYVALSREWDGTVGNAEPLLMLFCPQTVRAASVDGYHAIGWRVLQAWHDADSHAWPADVSTDPHSPFWSMCFAGMQLFVNMSNPAHTSRRSRVLGDGLVFVINPRERFDIVAGDNVQGRRVRANIRARIERYDGLAHCPQLGSYEAGEIEWWQYGLLDENRERQDRCPFAVRPEQVAAIPAGSADSRHFAAVDALPPQRAAGESA